MSALPNLPPLPQDLELLVAVGETCSKPIRLTREDIALFARLTGDTNPLHHDALAAQRARHGEIIAAGQHTTALMIGLASSHFSRPGQAFQRELLCLNFNFSFKAPVFAEQHVEMSWRVATVEWQQRLGGMLVQVDGRAAVPQSAPAVVGRGTLLIKSVPL